ncbi:MAG: hypothetical protein GY845_30425 [Planctomycetes bacterium]|nr:hypothetical protein [Planctomycetota bacterium]
MELTPEQMQQMAVQNEMGGQPGLNAGEVMPPPEAPPEPVVIEEEIIQTIENQLDAYRQSVNIAEKVDKDTLKNVAAAVIAGYDIDKKSREDWEEKNKQILELARQIGPERSFAGEEISNVKYPVLATASIQFSARALPNIIKGKEAVKHRVIGGDDNGLKAARGKRVSKYMNYQVLEEMPSWDEGMDQLLATLPLVGTVFKKTFYNPLADAPDSMVVMAEDLVVHYYAPSLEEAARVTHVIELSPNEIIERIRTGVFINFDYGDPEADEDGKHDSDDEDRPHRFYEQHRWYDLDDDGYQEPYIVTVHKGTEKVVRIVARWDSDGVVLNEKKEVARIEPVHFFTQYTFMQAFDGSFYKMGFGVLLAPMNSTINTTINQLLDAGTRAIRQGGFIGRGINLGKNASIKFKAGEWKTVPHSGDDLRKQLFPLPVKEPSGTLFQLLGLMLEASKELSSMADVLTGEQPRGDVPATTTLALIEQGLKVFSAIYVRIHRALKSEYKKIRRLDELYLDEKKYQNIVDDPTARRQDFQTKDMDIVPVSDDADLTDTQTLTKAQTLLSMLEQGLNDMEIKKRYLQALRITDIDLILKGPPPQPDPKLLIEQGKLQAKQRELDLKERELNGTLAEQYEKMIKIRSEAIKNLAIAEEKEMGPQLEQYAQQVQELSGMIQKQGAVLTQLGANNDQRGISGMEGAPNNPEVL